jgi:hypothetical protein
MSEQPDAVIVEGRGYIPDGQGGLILLGELGRHVPVVCADCGDTREFRLCSDEILSDRECDALLDKHLTVLGWSIGGGDRCPICTETQR